MFALEELLSEHSRAWLWTCGASAFTILLCLIHHALCYRRNIMGARENGSQFTILTLKPAFPSSGIMISLVIWQRSANDDQLSAFCMSDGEESFSHKLLRKPVNPSAGHSPLSREFWALWLLWCSPASREELGPLCFRFVSCFPLDVDTTLRTSDLKTEI